VRERVAVVPDFVGDSARRTNRSGLACRRFEKRGVRQISADRYYVAIVSQTGRTPCIRR